MLILGLLLGLADSASISSVLPVQILTCPREIRELGSQFRVSTVSEEKCRMSHEHSYLDVER